MTAFAAPVDDILLTLEQVACGRVCRQWAEQGWAGLTIPERYGGQGAGEPLGAALAEIFSGACHGPQKSVGLLPGAGGALRAHGCKTAPTRASRPMPSPGSPPISITARCGCACATAPRAPPIPGASSRWPGG